MSKEKCFLTIRLLIMGNTAFNFPENFQSKMSMYMRNTSYFYFFFIIVLQYSKENVLKAMTILSR